MRLRALFPSARRIRWVQRSILLAALIFSDLMKEPTSSGNSSGVFERLKLKCEVESDSWSFGEGEHLFSASGIGRKVWLCPKGESQDSGKTSFGEFTTGQRRKVI